MRTPDEPRDEPEELLDPELITRPARMTPSRTVPGETASVPCAHAERTSMAEGTTARGRTRMHDMMLRGFSEVSNSQLGARRLRRPLSVTIRVNGGGQDAPARRRFTRTGSYAREVHAE